MGGSNRGGGGGLGGAVSGAVGGMGTGSWGTGTREWLSGGGSNANFNERGVNGWFGKITGREGQREDSKAYQESVGKQNEETQGVLDQMKKDDSDYYNQSNDLWNQYQGDYLRQGIQDRANINKLKGQAESQATDAQKTYTNTIKPNMMNAMEDAKKQASQAMSLKDAGDPNNSVQTAVRAMYEKQAQGVGRQGLADSGVLSALGAQAMAGPMGNMGPMTGGQMQALQGANMGQAAQAYSRAQQRMDDLKQQGIDRGFSESAAQYDRGVGARERYSNTIKDVQNAQGLNQSQQQGYRGEIGGFNQQLSQQQTAETDRNMGMRAGLNALQYGQKQGQQGRELGRIGDFYGGQQAGIAGRMAQSGAQSGGIMGAVGQIGGAAAGGYFGGPMGAAAGGAAGQTAMGGGQSQAPAGQPSYGQGVNTAGGYGGGGGYYNYGGGYGYPYRPAG
jgi:hypothetical protein